MNLNIDQLQNLLLVSKGKKRGELLLRGGKVVNVFTRELLDRDITIYRDRIAGIDSYKDCRRKINCKGLYLLPGFIDGHIHLESTHLTPAQFARTVSPHGTTAVVLDPHEIANVSGMVGINWLIRATKKLPLDFFFMIPSSVPPSSIEKTGAVLNSSHVKHLMNKPRVLGLAEVMDISGILKGNRQVLKKVLAAGDYPIDGHAPLLSGFDLNAYIAAGISSDHESTSYKEAMEKLRLGMYIMIREGSLARDMHHLLKINTPLISERSFFVSDDLLPQDIAEEGHMDRILRRAVAFGLDPLKAVCMVSLNTANYFGLSHRGGIAPGYIADIVAVEDLKDFRIRWVMKGGRFVIRNERSSVSLKEIPPPAQLRKSMRAIKISRRDLKISPRAGYMRVIGLIPDSLVTRSLKFKPKVTDGEVLADPSRDILKLVVHDRHSRSKATAVGFVKGLTMKNGAMASTVAHDAHNLIAAGTDDNDIVMAINHLIFIGGGMVVVNKGGILADLPLPIGGLLSNKTATWMVQRMKKLDDILRQLGTILPHPFITLSFLSLSVIPELKMTVRGLVDVKGGTVVNLFYDN
jgi:adenine deaminase